MSGVRPELLPEPGPSAPAEDALVWKQPLSSIQGAIWIAASEADWQAVGEHVLRAAEIDDSDASSRKSTYLEMLAQSLAGVCQAVTRRIHREVNLTAGEEVLSVPAIANWANIRISVLQEGVLSLGFDDVLLDALTIAADPAEPAALPDSQTSPLGAQGSRTFDLLLEVELPVSVSFGRAQVQLKDVLKLTTGSIVELNRSISEPVEVIVNNCVIARGEVVVVEGNFGVRVQNVVSREERLRTLN